MSSKKTKKSNRTKRKELVKKLLEKKVFGKLQSTKKMSDETFVKYLMSKSSLDVEEIGRIMKQSEEGKECKWCKVYFKDLDDFCSPKCLEKYALEFLKKK